MKNVNLIYTCTYAPMMLVMQSYKFRPCLKSLLRKSYWIMNLIYPCFPSQFLLSSEFIQKVRLESQVSRPACAATPRASPVHSSPGSRTAWTLRSSCPNSSPCRVKRSPHMTVICVNCLLFSWPLIQHQTYLIWDNNKTADKRKAGIRSLDLKIC